MRPGVGSDRTPLAALMRIDFRGQGSWEKGLGVGGGDKKWLDSGCS